MMHSALFRMQFREQESTAPCHQSDAGKSDESLAPPIPIPRPLGSTRRSVRATLPIVDIGKLTDQPMLASPTYRGTRASTAVVPQSHAPVPVVSRIVPTTLGA